MNIVLGGVPLPRFHDHVRRYCGLEWSRGGSEVWAHPFFDALPDPEPDRVTNVDLVAVAAVVPGLSRRDLEWFTANRGWLQSLVAAIDAHADLDQLDHLGVEAIAALGDTDTGMLGLATRVAHRKRPRSVPMYGRHLVDRYRRRLDGRGESTWPHLLDALARDLRVSSNRAGLVTLDAELAGELASVPSRLRMVDIAIWMESHG